MTGKLSASEANAIKAASIQRDFRTDTITYPEPGMIEAQANASLGDSVYHEDQNTSDLEARVAALSGKEAALFCVSGTMTNQLAIRTHLQQPPFSVLLDSRSHVHLYEAGGVAFHSQANSLAITPSNGHHLTLEDVENNIIQGNDIHGAPTRIISLENTLSGMVMPQDEIIRIADAMKADGQGVIMHCDGARMWEVVAKTGSSLEELCRPFDTVSLCMSKGLGAPIGSILVGPKAHIEKARWFRKLFGGGIRQSGALAAAADYALTNHLPLLSNTHKLATFLAASLASLGVQILLPVETNMLWIGVAHLGFSLRDLISRAKTDAGITLGGARLIVHFQVTEQACVDLVEVVRTLVEETKGQADMSLLDRAQNESFVRGERDGMKRAERPVRIGLAYGTR